MKEKKERTTAQKKADETYKPKQLENNKKFAEGRARIQILAEFELKEDFEQKAKNRGIKPTQLFRNMLKAIPLVPVKK